MLDQYAGPDWITDMESLKLLEQWPGDKLLLSKIEETKLLGKHNLSNYIFDNLGVLVDPSSMFDIQVKRIHSKTSTPYGTLGCFSIFKNQKRKGLRSHSNIWW